MINYADKVFTRQYTQGDKKFYAAFHPEAIVERNEYATTGRYLVVLLHPEKGLEPFFINQDSDTGQWQPDENAAAIVEDELLEWLGNQLTTRQNSQAPVSETV